jgi:hypothetical protein
MLAVYACPLQSDERSLCSKVLARRCDGCLHLQLLTGIEPQNSLMNHQALQTGRWMLC